MNEQNNREILTFTGIFYTEHEFDFYISCNDEGKTYFISLNIKHDNPYPSIDIPPIIIKKLISQIKNLEAQGYKPINNISDISHEKPRELNDLSQLPF